MSTTSAGEAGIPSLNAWSKIDGRIILAPGLEENSFRTTFLPQEKEGRSIISHLDLSPGNMRLAHDSRGFDSETEKKIASKLDANPLGPEQFKSATAHFFNGQTHLLKAFEEFSKCGEDIVKCLSESGLVPTSEHQDDPGPTDGEKGTAWINTELSNAFKKTRILDRPLWM